jgi:hypothetical protein
MAEVKVEMGELTTGTLNAMNANVKVDKSMITQTTCMLLVLLARMY